MTWYSLSITDSALLSDIVTQIDTKVLIRVSGTPNGVKAAGVTGVFAFDYTNNDLYVCTATDGTVGGTTWTKLVFSISSATTSAEGVIAIAQDSDVNTGTDTTKAVTSHSVNAFYARKGANTDITSLAALSTPLSTAQGGTGAANLNALAKSGNNSDITKLTGLTTPLTTGQGGTGVTNYPDLAAALLPTYVPGGFLTNDGTSLSWGSASGVNMTAEFIITRAASNACLSAKVTGDSNDRVSIFSEGSIKFGSGTSTYDVLLKRSTATTLSIRNAGDTANGNLVVGALTADSLTLTTPLAVNQGGTGATNLNALAKSGANTDITSLGGLTTPLSTAQGGTGATNLNALAKSGANTDITSIGGLTTPLSTAQGGTGATNLNSLAKSGANTDITSIGGLTTPLSIAQGGTGATSLAGFGALANGGQQTNTDFTAVWGNFYNVSLTSGNHVITLPNAVGAAGQKVTFYIDNLNMATINSSTLPTLQIVAPSVGGTQQYINGSSSTTGETSFYVPGNTNTLTYTLTSDNTNFRAG